jgi:hypothetical protein
MARLCDTTPSLPWRLRVVFAGFNCTHEVEIARRRTSRCAGRWLLGSNGVRPPLSPLRNTSTSRTRAVLLPTIQPV